MASDSDAESSENLASNGDTVSVTEQRSSAERSNVTNAKTPKSSDESDDNSFFPQVLVKVEVNELDETITPPDLDEAEMALSPTTLAKKTRGKRKRKKVVSEFEASSDEDNQSPYSCKICDRTFNTPFNLRRHMPVHEGRLNCPLCGVRFKSKIYLGKHVARHEKTEKCDQCPGTFHFKKQLEDHIQSEHPEENECSDHNDSEIPDTIDWYKIPDLNNMSGGFLTRQQLTFTVQNAIVSKMHKGRSVADICRLYYITPDVVNDIWNDRDKFIIPKMVGKRSVKHMNSVLEPYVLAWYKAQKKRNVQLTGRMFQIVAEKIARDNGFVHFNAGNKWLEQFKKKNNIYLNKSKRDYSHTILVSEWRTKFFKEQWSEVRLEYADDEIYTADEVGLFYNPSDGRVKKLGGKKYIHGCPTDRLSILVCANISGNDKRRLLVCGTADPLRRSQRDADTLPVEYRRHQQCKFTTKMFEDYVTRWNVNLQMTNKRAVLILDRASIHSKLELSNLKLVFIPWKSANSLMPVKNGIFMRLRTEFRNLLLQFKVMNVLKGIDRHLTCLEAIEMLARAWNQTSSYVITKSFIDIGYDSQNLDNTKQNDNLERIDETLCEILRDYDVEPYFIDSSNLDMYLTVDDDLVTGQGTNPTVFGGNHKVSDPKKENADCQPTETEFPNEKELFVIKSRALSDLEVVRKYLQSNSTSYEVYCKFMDVEKAVMENFVKLDT